MPRLGIALIVVLSLAWGASWPMMKIAVGAVPPWTFRVLTTVLAGAVFLLALRLTGISIRIPPRRLGWLVLSSLVNVTIWMMCSAFALTMLPAGRSVIIAYSMPVWAVLLGAVFLGERIDRSRVMGLVLGLAGLAVLVGEDLGDLTAAPLGALLMTAGAVSWAAGTIILKRIDWGMTAVAFSGWQLLVGGVPVLACALLWESGSLGPVGWREVGALLYVFFIAVMIGNYAWIKIVSLMPAGVASIGTVAIPVVGVISGALVLGEAVGWRELVALILVVASLAAVLMRPVGGAPRPRRRPLA